MPGTSFELGPSFRAHVFRFERDEFSAKVSVEKKKGSNVYTLLVLWPRVLIFALLHCDNRPCQKFCERQAAAQKKQSTQERFQMPLQGLP